MTQLGALFDRAVGTDHDVLEHGTTADVCVPPEYDIALQLHVAAYCRRTGRAGIARADWEYYMVFNMFRLAAIMQGIMARALSGTAASSEALEMGRRARPLAELAWRQVERLRE